MKNTRFYPLSALLLAVLLSFTACVTTPTESNVSDDISNVISDTVSSSDDSSLPNGESSAENKPSKPNDTAKYSDPLSLIDKNALPEYEGATFVALNDNEPIFTESEITDKAFESYTKLDSLGRCGIAFACVGRETMPTEPRGDISSIKPSGWKSIQYDIVSGKSLYNRSHLLGFQLTGENANELNLITGTRYMNADGMLPFENMVADYVKETGNHVLLRVTPVFVGNELVARGVIMEAYSVEDEGDGVYYNVYCFNVQPGIEINYSDGTSRLKGESNDNPENKGETYVLNTNSKKFHRHNCSSVKDISDKNRKDSDKSRDELIAEGYSPCKSCNP